MNSDKIIGASFTVLPPETGHGGGYVFTYNGAKYEISAELTTGGSKNDGRCTWMQAINEAKVYRGGNLTDWRLPLKDELNVVYLELFAEGKPLQDDTLTNYLWSSSECYTNYTWTQRFRYGYQFYTDKTYIRNVRVVRALAPLKKGKEGANEYIRGL